MTGGPDDASPRSTPPIEVPVRQRRLHALRTRWRDAPTTLRVAVAAQALEFVAASALAVCCLGLGIVLVVASTTGPAAAHANDYRGLAAIIFFGAALGLALTATALFFCTSGLLRRSRASWIASICLLLIVSWWWTTAAAASRAICWSVTVPQLCLLLWPTSARHLLRRPL